MANFNIAYIITLGNEIGYSNDPIDNGGETYNGISRVNEPEWLGWPIIDKAKKESNFPANLKNYQLELIPLQQDIYKKKYWDIFWGDQIPNQFIANEIFDSGVNRGIRTAIKYLQRSLNIANRNQRLYPDISVDGKFGHNTLTTLNKFLSIDKPELLYKIMNIMQGADYISIMENNPSQEKWIGWFSRIQFIK